MTIDAELAARVAEVRWRDLAATAWRGFTLGGRCAIVMPSEPVAYLASAQDDGMDVPCVAARFEGEAVADVVALVAKYDPNREIVFCLVGGAAIVSALNAWPAEGGLPIMSRVDAAALVRRLPPPPEAFRRGVLRIA